VIGGYRQHFLERLATAGGIDRDGQRLFADPALAKLLGQRSGVRLDCQIQRDLQQIQGFRVTGPAARQIPCL
jgi:hypothetical protein